MSHLVSRRVGQTALRLPVLGLGTCPLGGVYAEIDEETAAATFAAAWDAGIRLYDTAPWYGLGQAEHRTGHALRSRPRGDFVLSTKVGRVLRAPADRASFRPAGWVGALPFEHSHRFTYDAIMRSYEDSLQRLGINQVDLLYIHDLDSGYFRDEASLAAALADLETSGYRALETLKRSGEVAAIGAGINERGMIGRFLDRIDLDVFLVASRYTLLEQGIYHDEFARLRARGASVVIGGAFSSGILATGGVEGARHDYAAAPAAVIERVRQLEAVARAHGVALPAAALQFPLAAPEVAAVVVGAVTPAEIRANVAHVCAPVPAGFWSDLRSAGLIDPGVPVPTGAGATAAPRAVAG